MNKLRHWVVLIVCLLLLAGLLLPFMEQARKAARKMQSENNLKWLGLAFANYNDTYRHYPIGADGDSDEAKHGWYTRLMPYIESSSLYVRIDQDFPWDHLFNAHLFQRAYGPSLNPQIDWKFTSESYGLLHYFGNPRIVHRNNSVREEELSTGLSHTWIGSEINQRFQPWGYPFNWRSLTEIAAEQHAKPILWNGEFQVCYADNSVHTLAAKVDPTVIQRLDEAAPAVSSEKTAIPQRVFDFSRTSTVTFRTPLNDRDFRYKEVWGHELTCDLSGRAHTLEYFTRAEEPLEGFTKCLAENSELRVIVLGHCLTDALARPLEQLEHLEALKVDGSSLTSAGVESLAKLGSLKFLAGIDERSLAEVQQALPSCQITFDKQ